MSTRHCVFKRNVVNIDKFLLIMCKKVAPIFVSTCLSVILQFNDYCYLFLWNSNACTAQVL